MAQLKPFLAGTLQDQPFSAPARDHSARVQPEYVTVVNSRRKFVEVSPAFCKLLGYTQDELLGKSYDDVTVPRTNNIPLVLEMFLQVGHMSGIWVLTTAAAPSSSSATKASSAKTASSNPKWNS